VLLDDLRENGDVLKTLIVMDYQMSVFLNKAVLGTSSHDGVTYHHIEQMKISVS
jgi:hypothetical protein